MDGGYADYLRTLIGVHLRNHSIGDQTSIMGNMRLRQTLANIAPGDVVVWEYPLLDALLTEAGTDADMVVSAFSDALRLIDDRHAQSILVEITPRAAIIGKTRPAILNEITRIAHAFGVPVIDTSEVCKSLGLHEAGWADEYSDDRHLLQHSDVSQRLAQLIVDRLADLRKHESLRRAVVSQSLLEVEWHSLESLANRVTNDHRPPQSSREIYANSFLSCDALVLREDDFVPIERTDRLVIGVVSSVDSGFVWCGHLGCPPASTRLPEELSKFKFLLRTTRLPCMRIKAPLMVRAAPAWSLQGSIWGDYGQSLERHEAPVAVFGALGFHFQPLAIATDDVDRRTARPSLASNG